MVRRIEKNGILLAPNTSDRKVNGEVIISLSIGWKFFLSCPVLYNNKDVDVLLKAAVSSCLFTYIL